MKSLPLMVLVTVKVCVEASPPLNRAVYADVPWLASKRLAYQALGVDMAHETAASPLAWRACGGTLHAMPHAVRHQVSSRRSPPRRALLACGLLSGAIWWPLAHAGSLYHCAGAHDEAVFTSTTTGYHDCRKLGSYAAPARRGPTASLQRVQGGAVGTRTRFEAASVALAGVQGSVLASARPLSAPAVASNVPAALRGRWTYQQGGAADALAAVPDATAPGDRVLRGAVYRIARADGSVEYTNIPPAGRAAQTAKRLFTYIATCFACSLHSAIHWGSLQLNLTAYADAIRAASVEYGVDEAFLRAIIHAESAFNPNALSIKGAQGLMQLMPGTASDMGVLDAFNSEQNIRGGARYLGLLLHDFNGNEHLAAAAYNAGPAAVQRYNGVPPYAETQVYVQRVDTLRKRYEAALHPPLAALRPAG